MQERCGFYPLWRCACRRCAAVARANRKYIVPGDKDAKLKMQECEKMVRRLDFLKAIEMGEPPSAAEGLDLDSMVVEPEYDGVRLGKEMTQEFIDDMIERFKKGKKIHKKYAYQIVMQVKEVFMGEPTMPEVKVEEGKRLTVCGDTHGMLSRIVVKGIWMLIRWNRPVLRSARDLQPQRLPLRQARLPLQRRLC